MIQTFTTESGSVYRYDTVAQTIERINGIGEATTRIQNAKRYRSLTAIGGQPLRIGARALIVWHESDYPDREPGSVPTTITSTIIAIDNIEATG